MHQRKWLLHPEIKVHIGSVSVFLRQTAAIIGTSPGQTQKDETEIEMYVALCY